MGLNSTGAWPSGITSCRSWTRSSCGLRHFIGARPQCLSCRGTTSTGSVAVVQQLERRGAQEGGRYGALAVAADDDQGRVVLLGRLEQHLDGAALGDHLLGLHAGGGELLDGLVHLALAVAPHELRVIVELGAHHQRRVGHAHGHVADGELVGVDDHHSGVRASRRPGRWCARAPSGSSQNRRSRVQASWACASSLSRSLGQLCSPGAAAKRGGYAARRAAARRASTPRPGAATNATRKAAVAMSTTAAPEATSR